MEQLQQLFDTLEYQESIKKDFIAPTTDLTFVGGELIMLHAGQEVTLKPTDLFHGQVAEKLGIPKTYYDKMRQKAINLLDDNANHWLRDEGKNILLRTFQNGDNVARAFLSDRFKIIDNFPVLTEALEAIRGTGLHVDVIGAELSETRMFLKVVCPEIEIQATEMLKLYRKSIERGSGVISGFTLQNSEVGYGTFSIAARAVVLACNNGMVCPEDGFKRAHLGGKMDQLDFHKNSDVMNANRKLIKEQVRHAVKTFLSKDYLTRLVNKFTEMGDKPIDAPIASVMEVVAKDYGISQEHKKSLLDHFIRGGDDRRIGVVNALTEMVQTIDDVDVKNDTEAIGFDVLKNFNKIEAAAIRLDAKAN